MHAADDAFEELIAADVVIPGVDQAGLIRDVKGELALFLDDDDVAGLLVDSRADHVHQTLGFAGPLEAHDDTQHVVIRSFSLVGLPVLSVVYHVSGKGARAEMLIFLAGQKSGFVRTRRLDGGASAVIQ